MKRTYTKRQQRSRRSNTGMSKKYGMSYSRGASSTKAVVCPSRFYKNAEQFKKKRG